MLTRAEHERPTAMIVSVGVARRRSDSGDEDAARADAEQRQPDDEVRVVVAELERDDPRVADLEQQPGQADEEDLEVVGAAVDADVVGQPPVPAPSAPVR